MAMVKKAQKNKQTNKQNIKKKKRKPKNLIKASKKNLTLSNLIPWETRNKVEMFR